MIDKKLIFNGQRWALLLLTATLVGCRQDGPARYEVTGEVTYNGAAVPAGSISFDPDTTQGNRGPGGYAIIKNGTYRTLPNRGVVGGPHVIRVRGFQAESASDEPGGHALGPALFEEMSTKAELPHAKAQYDIHLDGV